MLFALLVYYIGMIASRGICAIVQLKAQFHYAD